MKSFKQITENLEMGKDLFHSFFVSKDGDIIEPKNPPLNGSWDSIDHMFIPLTHPDKFKMSQRQMDELLDLDDMEELELHKTGIGPFDPSIERRLATRGFFRSINGGWRNMKEKPENRRITIDTTTSSGLDRHSIHNMIPAVKSIRERLSNHPDWKIRIYGLKTHSPEELEEHKHRLSPDHIEKLKNGQDFEFKNMQEIDRFIHGRGSLSRDPGSGVHSVPSPEEAMRKAGTTDEPKSIQRRRFFTGDSYDPVLNIKSFKSYITEALNRRQEYYIDREIHNAGDYARDTEFSDHIFGGPSSGLGRHDDHDVITIPFDMSHFQNPPEELVSHLDKHGYRIHDWNNRLAVATKIAPGAKARPIRIRKALQATEGSDGYYLAVHKLNEHDNIAPYLKKGLQIMITRHPYHVAEQSTNKGWRSCMALGVCPDEDRGFIGDLEHSEAIRSNERGMEQARRLGRANQAVGENAHKVPDDILGGTHMAYLTVKGDRNLKRPLGRISLKPYHSRDIMTKTNNWLYRNKNFYEWGTRYGRMRDIPVKDIPWKYIKPRHTILRSIGLTYTLQELARHPLMDQFRNAVNHFTETHFPMDPHEEDYQLDKLVHRNFGEQEWIKNPNYGKTT